MENVTVENVHPFTQLLKWTNVSLGCPFAYRIKYWPDNVDESNATFIFLTSSETGELH